MQVVDGVEIDIVQLADLRLDVPRHGDVNHKHRLVLAPLQRLLYRALAEDRQLTGGGADDDVAVVQLFRDIGKQDCLRPQLRRQRTGALEGTVGDDDFLHALLVQVARHQSDGFASADQQRLAALQVAEDLPRQADRGEGHRHRVLADGGVGPHGLGRAEGGLEQPS